MTERNGRPIARPSLAIIAILALLALPFVPQLLSIAEESIIDTNYVENVCRSLGVHDDLGRLYDAFGIK